MLVKVAHALAVAVALKKHRPGQSTAELRGMPRMASILVAPGIASYQKPTRQRRRNGDAHSSIARIPYFKVLAFGLWYVCAAAGLLLLWRSIQIDLNGHLRFLECIRYIEVEREREQSMNTLPCQKKMGAYSDGRHRN